MFASRPRYNGKADIKHIPLYPQLKLIVSGPQPAPRKIQLKIVIAALPLDAAAKGLAVKRIAHTIFNYAVMRWRRYGKHRRLALAEHRCSPRAAYADCTDASSVRIHSRMRRAYRLLFTFRRTYIRRAAFIKAFFFLLLLLTNAKRQAAVRRLLPCNSRLLLFNSRLLLFNIKPLPLCAAFKNLCFLLLGIFPAFCIRPPYAEADGFVLILLRGLFFCRPRCYGLLHACRTLGFYAFPAATHRNFTDIRFVIKCFSSAICLVHPCCYPPPSLCAYTYPALLLPTFYIDYITCLQFFAIVLYFLL